MKKCVDIKKSKCYINLAFVKNAQKNQIIYLIFRQFFKFKS